jgi:hypothetical protein
MAGSLKTVATEFAKYKLDLVAVQEVRGDVVVVSQQTVIYFSMAMEMPVIT